MRSGKWGLCLLSLAFIAVIITSGCARKRPQTAAATGAVEQATPVFVVKAELGDIDQVEHLTGTVEPNREVDVQSEIPGKVSWVGVDVGDRVSRGQALVKLDVALAASGVRQSEAAEQAAQARYGQSRVGLKLTSEQTISAVRQAEQNMEQARNRLRQVKIAADLTRTRIEEAITQAQIGVKQAQAQLADVKAGARTQEIAQAQARVDQAKSAVRLAKLNLDRMNSLVKSGAVAQAQVDAAQVEYENAQGNQRVAEQALDLAKEGARTEQVRLAELQVTQAQQALTQAESQRGQIDVAERDVRAAEVTLDQAEESVRLARAQRAQVAATEQEVRAAQAGVSQARATTQLSRTQVAKHTVYSPISGTVAARNVDPGEGASPGIALIRVVNLDPVRINCEASELQVDRMRLGQESAVTIDALPGRQFLGTVTDIAPQSQQGKRIYIVRLTVVNPQGVLRAGMFARADVITGVHRHTVLVPRDTLVERGEKRVVYAVEGDRVKVRDVSIGAADESRVEITGGVRAGDALVFGGQSLLGDGELVKPEPRPAAGAAAGPASSGPTATGP